MMEMEVPKRSYSTPRVAIAARIRNFSRVCLRWVLQKCSVPRSGARRAFHSVPPAAIAETKPLRVAPKVLIFDQDFSDLARHAEPFEVRGCEVYKCSSIEAAMRCAEREDLDFALVDEASPAFASARLIRHLIRYNSRMAFAVVGRGEESVSHQMALPYGAFEYFKKPIPNSEIDRLICSYL
jgi:PleD family two-component response regulator